MNILLYTSLYPNSAQIRHGIFVEQRLRHLLKTHDLKVKVVAPVPWFPFKHQIFGKYGIYAQIPSTETRHGFEVHHPRFLTIPVIGKYISPLLMAFFSYFRISRIKNQGFDFGLIDAHFIYPDGAAGIILGKLFRKPVTMTARGNDLSICPESFIPRVFIKWALKQCAATITVCQALASTAYDLGANKESVHVMRNGVDLDLFHPPANREISRKKAGFDGFTLLCVGHFIERKGQYLVIKALQSLPDATLVLVGDGEMENQLRNLAKEVHVENRVRFLGGLPQNRLPAIYGMADCMVLASSREGLANVLLESMACGTPVVATPVWGTPEIVTEEGGVLTKDRTVGAIVEAVETLRSINYDRQKVRKYAEQFSWQATSDAQYELFENLVGNH